MENAPHFTVEELTHSDVAERMGIINLPTNTVLANLTLLAKKLEQVRAILGVPVIISSGYRCRALNIRVGGSSTSAHTEGLAADFTAPEFGSPLEICRELLKHADELQWDQLIYEMTWVHLGYSLLVPRGEVLTAKFVPGNAVYANGIIG